MDHIELHTRFSWPQTGSKSAAEGAESPLLHSAKKEVVFYLAISRNRL